MKRVYCLYRVSTLGQVEKDDIPMQREACHEFVKTKGWIITQEFTEKGISGYKVSSENREALQDIKKAAIQKVFDVLLVFMFDRLGRRDDETPFVVEWFVKNGVEVWSVVEGEQRFEDHVDKLLNYIRYWQSSGESLKISIRTRTRMEQLTKEGYYIGGSPPFGYKICKIGRFNKRGFEVHDILVDYEEANVVKTIFDLYCSGKMGTYRIAQHLNKQGYVTKNGSSWGSASISSILKNPVYTGIRKFGNVQSDIFPHLQIIDTDTLRRAQRQADKNKLIIPRGPRSEHAPTTLFADVLFCMQCGKRITVTRNKKVRNNKDGTQADYIRMNYICINKRSIDFCTGQRSYSVRCIDSLFSGIIGDFLQSYNFDHIPLTSTDNNLYNEIETLEVALDNEKKKLDVLQREAVEVMLGTSAFLPVLITDLIQNSKSKISDLENEILILYDTKREQNAKMSRFHEVRKQLSSGKNITFDSLPLGEQQDIIEQLVERFYIGRGYNYRIEWTFGGYLQGEISANLE